MPASASQVMQAAQDHMRQQRWSLAAELLDGEATPQQNQTQRLICRNLAAMQRHRPDIYTRLLKDSGANANPYSLISAARGQQTILYRARNQAPVCLSFDNDPAVSLKKCLDIVQIDQPRPDGVGLLGIGDGYLLNHLAHHPVKLDFDRQFPVYLVEPDPRAILTCMGLHDYTGPSGPIEQQRFYWIVGADWPQMLSHHLFDDDCTRVFPSRRLNQSVNGQQIIAQLNATLQKGQDLFTDWQKQTAAYYAAIPAEHWSSAFARTLGRKSRALLLTTRFSTVLHYSTRAVADALEELGWDTKLFIESTTHQPLSHGALAKLLWDFKPDLIFQIDHLRGEWGWSFPLQIPFVCWIQDHLSNLTRHEAGKTITKRDFVLCGMPAMYIDHWGYPTRQCLHMARLTVLPKRPASWTSDGDDLVYVSSASAQPQERIDQLLHDSDLPPDGRKLMEVCSRQILDVYQRGENLSTPKLVQQQLAAAEKEANIHISNDALRRQLADVLFDRLSNLLYRQQGLRWAVEAARRENLRLSIYGGGWDKHPEFAAYARGPIRYGSDLEALTRNSRINLVLEPYFTPSHQRLLDALVAGGFCLSRDHPSHALFEDLAHFLCAHLPVCPARIEEARSALNGENLAALNEILARWDAVLDLGDAVSYVHGALEARKLMGREPVLPEFLSICFSNFDELHQCVRTFVHDTARRDDLARRQRQAIEGRLSYTAGMHRVMERIAGLMNEETVLTTVGASH